MKSRIPLLFAIIMFALLVTVSLSYRVFAETVIPTDTDSTPVLSISKSAPATAYVNEPITYTLSIVNNGTISATNLLVTDTLPLGASYVSGGTQVGDEVQWAIAQLDAGGAMATTEFVVTAAGTVTNADYGVAATGGYSATGMIEVVTMVGDPALSISKSGPASALVDEEVTYTLTVTNSGVMTATGLTIVDTLPTGATHVSGGTLVGSEVQWSLAELAPNGGTDTVSFVVTASDTVTNDDYGVSADGGFSATGTDGVMTLVGDPALSISKSGPATALVDEQITYMLTVTNNGVMTATGVTITDTVPTGATHVSGGTLVGNVVQWDISDLVPNGGTDTVSFIVTASATITNDDYRVSADGGFSATGSESVTTVIGTPALTITKNGPTVALPDSPIHYTLFIANNGSLPATNVTVTDTVPVGATWQSGGIEDNGVVSWSIPSLAPTGVAAAVHFTVTASTDITNFDYGALDENGFGATGSDVIVTEVGLPVLQISKTAPSLVLPEELIVYTLSVTNTGVSPATNLEILDVVPAGAQYVGGGNELGGIVRWDVAELAPDASINVQFSATANSTVVNNSYSAMADNGVSVAGTESVVTVVGTPDLAISKAGPDTAYINNTITYQLQVSNNGIYTATGVTVTDNVPTGAIYVGSGTGGINSGGVVTWSIDELAPGESLNLDFSVRKNAAGTVVNDTYNVTADGGYSATGTAVVTTLVGNPRLTISKTGPSLVLPGSLIQYELTLSNIGTMTATGVVITDVLPIDVEYVSGGTLNAGVVTWDVGELGIDQVETAQFVVRRLTPGVVVNDDYGASTEDGFGVSGTRVVTTTVAEPVLHIVKRAPGSALPNQPIEYTITVSNTGLISATNLLIADTLPVGSTWVSGGSLVGDEVQWSVASLMPNQQTSVNFTVTAQNTIVNEFYEVSADGGYQAMGDKPVTTAIGEPNLSISKTGPDSAYAGDNFDYTLTVRNTGALMSTNLVVTDVVPLGATWVSGGSYDGTQVTWMIDELAVDETRILQFTVNADSTVVNDNYGVVDEDGFSADGNASVTTVVGTPGLAITKSGPETAFVDDPIVYDLIVVNTGTLTATNLIITDVVPTGATYVSGGTYDEPNNTVAWDVSELGIGDDVSVSFTVTAAATIVNDTYLVTADHDVAATGDGSVTTVVANPALTIEKSGPASAFIGETVTYTLTIANSGLLTATQLVITDQLPVGSTFLFASDAGVESAGTVTWNVSEVPPAGQVTVQFSVSANATIVNDTYAVSADGGFSAVGDTSVTTLIGDPAFAIVKSGPTQALADEPFTYTLTVTNTGGLTATNLLITDMLPAGATWVSGGTVVDGEVSWTITELAPGDDVVVQFTVSAASTVTNDTYSVSADGEFSAVGSVSVVTTIGEPVLTIVKTGPSEAAPGEPIQYEITVVNTSLFAATNLFIRDTVPDGATYVSGGGGTLVGDEVRWTVSVLEPGDSTTVRFTVTAQDDIVNDDYRVSADSGDTAVGTVAVTTQVGSPVVFLPLMIQVPFVDEPNDSCSAALQISIDTLHKFMPDDQFDWYTFDLNVTSPTDLQVKLSNFVPLDGQIALYKGDSCSQAQFIQNNGVSSQTKTLNVSNQTSGRYFIVVVNDGDFYDDQAYDLIVRTNP